MISLQKRVMQLPEPKRQEEVGRTANPLYYRYHRMVSHPLEKCVTLKEYIMQLIKDGTIILDLDDVVCMSMGCHPVTQEGLFPVSTFDKLPVNMILCSEVEEEIGEEDGI